jgi:hypothetical protein
MGGTCGTYGGDEVHVGFCWGNLKEIEHLEDLDVDGSIVLKSVLKKSIGRAWTDLTQDRNKWTAFVNGVMNLRVPKNVEIILVRRRTFGFSRRTLQYGVS